MIKINLLEVEKERRPKAAAVSAGGPPTSLIALIIIGGALAGFIFYFITINNRISALEADIIEKRARKKELEPYIKRVEELDKRREDLAKKNRAIEELRSQRTIPVHILDEISRALPEYLWLTGFAMKGEVLNLDGETLQEQAIPTFMRRLGESEFLGTCSLIETQQRTHGGGDTATTTTLFKISTPITNPFKPKDDDTKTKTKTKTKR